ncbi:MAG: DUF6443 domain-containing protein, partial [Flavobacteriales bacterium]|nr:DUF6443 domain-containing protein [Flavobacteriales bacterium]
SDKRVTSAELFQYQDFGNDLNNYHVSGIKLLNTLTPLQNFHPAHSINQTALAFDPRYDTNNEYEFIYSATGELQQQFRAGDVKQTFIWSNDNRFPIAKVINAEAEEIAYTGFEDHNFDAGGWIFNQNTSTNVLLGNKSFKLSYANEVRKNNAPSGEYILGLWAASGDIEVYVNNSLVYSKSGIVDYENLQINLSLNANSNFISVQGHATIDELRLHPKDAQMLTYCFDASSQSMLGQADLNNFFQSYSYDEFNRLQIIRDHQANIRNYFEYYLKGNNGRLHNEIHTYIPQVENLQNVSDILNQPVESVLREVSYLDGLGRLVQHVKIDQSPTKRDIVSIKEYSGLDFELKKYLPFTVNIPNDSYLSNAKLRQNLFYGSPVNSYGYEEYVTDQSPLKRVIESATPGLDWRIGSGHEKNNLFRTNTLNEVRKFDNLNSLGYYPAGSLLVLTEIDENGNSVTSYNDKLGKQILVDQQGSLTYKVYNDLSRLVAILPPTLVEQMLNQNDYNVMSTSNRKGAFLYNYDAKGNIVRKDLPGAEPTMLYYDRLNRLVLTIDGNNNKKFQKYDQLSRPIYAGSYTGSVTPSNEQLFEETANNASGYTLNQAFPTSNFEIHEISYYDHYDFNGDNQISNFENFQADIDYASIHNPLTFGQLTGSKIAVIEPIAKTIESWEETSSFFDEFYQPILTKTINSTGELDKEYLSYDFNGNIIKSKLLHRTNLGGLKAHAIEKEMILDHANRLLETYHSVDGNTPVLVSKRTYNERELLRKLSLGQVEEDNFLQNIDYRYNIKGWLTSINGVKENCGNIDKEIGGFNDINASKQRGTNSNTPIAIPSNLTTENTDLFSMILRYNQYGSNPQYNGNISQVIWQSGCGEVISSYAFEYDNRNQLINSEFSEGNSLSTLVQTNSYNTSYSYDKSGNVNTLERYENGNLIDDLSYTYDSENHIINLEELADYSIGFKSQLGQAGFGYDNNGNMTRDDHKGLNISYNEMNLPTVFAYDTGDSLKIVYNSTGSKLAKYSKANGATWSVKNYLNHFEYLDNTLEAIYFDEGRVVSNNNNWIY